MASTPEQLRQLIAATGYGPEAAAASLVTEALAGLAATEGLAPLLGARLAAGELTAEDDDVRQRLLDAWRACSLAGTVLSMGVEPLLGELRRRGIPALLMKGEALIRGVYGDPGRRPMADLDLLVPARQWRPALAAAAASGARPVAVPDRPLTLHFFHEMHLRLPAGGLLDLHRALVPWPLFAVDLDGLFERASEQQDGALLPAPEDLFVMLVLHAAKDGFLMPLRSVVDGLALIRGKIRHGTLRPDAVEAVARRWAARRATARWLHFLDHLGDLDAAWTELARRLAPRLEPLPPDRPLPRATSPADGRWRMRWQQARFQDQPLRPLVSAGLWLLLYAGDLGVRLVRRPFAGRPERGA